MARRRETGGVYQRAGIWWVHYRVEGERFFESTEQRDKRVAQSILAERRREIREGTWQRPEDRAMTVATYAERWFAARRVAGVQCAAQEESDIRRWLLPSLGSHLLSEVKRSDLRDVLAAIEVQRGARKGERAAPRTVLRIYAAIRGLFASALDDGQIAATPATLKTRRGELPVKRDVDPRWRAGSVYTRDEAETLIGDPRIPEDRRVYYALQLLAGMRASEAGARQWRDLDAGAEPLGRLLVATQASSGGGERETKTLAVKEVPVHPTLAAILDRWRTKGWPLLYKRQPTPDDLIVPSRADGRSPRSSGAVGTMKADLARCGLRTEGRARHAMRATFLTLLEVDGANMGLVRRATHAAPGDAFSGYLRAPWPAVCAEVGKLKIELRRHAEVVPLRAVASAGSGYSSGYSPSKSTENAPKTGGLTGCRTP